MNKFLVSCFSILLLGAATAAKAQESLGGNPTFTSDYRPPPYMFSLQVQTDQAPVPVKEIYETCTSQASQVEGDIEAMDQEFAKCLAENSLGMMTAFPRGLDACRLLVVPNGTFRQTSENSAVMPVMAYKICVDR